MSGGILTGIYNAGKETFGVERQYTAGPNQRWAARKTLTITSRSGVALSAATEWQKQHGGGAKSPGTPRAGLGPPGMGAATRMMFGAAASFRPMLGLVGSDVPSQARCACVVVAGLPRGSGARSLGRAREGTRPADVGQQVLMRGLGTACPPFRLGLPCVWVRASIWRSASQPTRGFPTVGPVPAVARGLQRRHCSSVVRLQ